MAEGKTFREHIRSVSGEARQGAAQAGQRVSQAYRAVGGVAGAARSVRDYAHETFGPAGSVDERARQARDYVTSDEGRANARHTVASSFQRFLSDRAKRMGKRGGPGYIAGSLYQFAANAIQSHVTKLGHEHRTFRDVARVRRGDPEIMHMTHEELRNVAQHAKSYGGADHASIAQNAQRELERRAQRTQAERNRTARATRADADAHRQELAHARHAEEKKKRDEFHQQKMAQLREVSGHVNEAVRARQEMKTAGARTRTGLRLTGKKTKLGQYDSKGTWYSNEEIAASRKAASKAKAPRAQKSAAGARKSRMR